MTSFMYVKLTDYLNQFKGDLYLFMITGQLVSIPFVWENTTVAFPKELNKI